MDRPVVGKLALLALLPMVAVAAKNVLPKASRIPSNPTEENRGLVREGVALHDQGDYAGAIAKYQQVLDHSPDDVGALYELTFTYYSKKDYQSGLKTAKRGAEYKSQFLPRFHMMIANILDDTGKREEAVATYREAIHEAPELALLHYNLGLTLKRSRDLANAKKELELSMSLDPKHASSQFQLAAIYAETRKRIPAILALSRFLMLEPDSARAQTARDGLLKMIGAGVTQGEKEGSINITLSLPSKKVDKEDGDFSGVDMMIAIAVAAGTTEEKKNETSFEKLAHTYELMGSTLASVKPEGFAARYYAPFFAELGHREYGKAFVSCAFAGANLEGAGEWTQKNTDKIREFTEWAAAYGWTKMK